MKKENIAYLAVGLALGAATAWLFSKQYYTKREERNISSVKDMYATKIKKLQDDAVESREGEKKAVVELMQVYNELSYLKNELGIDEDQESSEEPKPTKSKEIKEELEESKDAANAIAHDSGYLPKEEPDDMDEEDEYPEDFPKDDPDEEFDPLMDEEYEEPRIEASEDYAELLEGDDPFVIPEGMFRDAMMEGGTYALLYFEDDDVLTDEDDKPIEEAEYLIGDALDHFGDKSNNKDIVYVYNPINQTGYEIQRIHDSFQHDVLGVEMDEEDKIPRKLRKHDFD